MSWTTISVRREVRERIEAFMREKGFVSPSDAIAFLFEHYDSRIKLEEKMRELEERISFVEKCMEDVLFAKAPTSTPQAQAPQAPQQPQPSPSPPPPPLQPPAQQPPQQLPEPTPKLIPASELPEAKKALEERAKPSKAEEAGKEVKVELRPFVIKRNPSNPEAYKKWLESQGRTVTGEVEEVTKKGLVKIVFGTTSEVVDKICEKLTELKVPPGALNDKSERAKMDKMFTEEPLVDLGIKAYLLSRACLIIRGTDGVWRRV